MYHTCAIGCITELRCSDAHVMYKQGQCFARSQLCQSILLRHTNSIGIIIFSLQHSHSAIFHKFPTRLRGLNVGTWSHSYNVRCITVWTFAPITTWEGFQCSDRSYGHALCLLPSSSINVIALILVGEVQDHFFAKATSIAMRSWPSPLLASASDFPYRHRICCTIPFSLWLLTSVMWCQGPFLYNINSHYYMYWCTVLLSWTPGTAGNNQL